jgi:uncharacterized sulfatase
MRILVPLILALLALAALPASAADAPRRNVLFIVADDLCADLGCYGAPVQSPNIDRLASQGVRFDRAYCQFPLCGPSRCSFMSGLRPDTIGVLANGLTVRHKLKDVVTLPQLFRNNGYRSMRVGKMYHLNIPDGVGTPGPDDAESWDSTFNPKGAEYDTDGEAHDPNPKDHQSFRYVMGKSDDGAEQHDMQAADEAIRLLTEHKDKPGAPFFLALGFIRPHVPEIAPRKYFDLYPLEQIKLPPRPENDRADIPPMAFQPQDQGKGDRGMTEPQCLESIRAYRATTSFMDAQVGRVLDALQRLQLSDNTVVVFLGDHGYSLGQHRTWQKMTLFEPVARVPMIIRAPGVQAGTTKSIVESIDLYPTLAALCGLTPPRELQGADLSQVLRDPSATVKPAAYTQLRRGQQGEGRSVRTDRFRYTEWSTPRGPAGAELYDEQADPGEFHNLASDPAHAKEVEQLRQLLHAHDAASRPSTTSAARK